ncbi:VOC family protein [Flavobacterium sp. '19STA2R22 D10 B1']|uniref:VOC family protein n=1 Tax=Flavobacterium aerium TaxID=3037261 RepID=UPI00278BF9FB|nr:glyoxalase [Flavobacterium sp. '19STA2R22 D10 B1']
MKIKELYLLTNNLIATESFYNTILNIPTLEKNKEYVSFEIGATKVHFVTAEQKNPVYHLAIDIPQNQLEEAFAWLESRTIILSVTKESAISDFVMWNAKSFYFYDNNGNLLEFIARFDLDNASSVPFDSTSIVSVSEIGIVTKDVPTLINHLMDEYGLKVFSKQPRDDNFTVLGDEIGLLIVVNENRNWYPTTEKANPFWTKIIFDNGTGKDQELIVN